MFFLFLSLEFEAFFVREKFALHLFAVPEVGNQNEMDYSKTEMSEN
jgi:hypothetical protein